MKKYKVKKLNEYKSPELNVHWSAIMANCIGEIGIALELYPNGGLLLGFENGDQFYFDPAWVEEVIEEESVDNVYSFDRSKCVEILVRDEETEEWKKRIYIEKVDGVYCYKTVSRDCEENFLTNNTYEEELWRYAKINHIPKMVPMTFLDVVKLGDVVLFNEELNIVYTAVITSDYYTRTHASLRHLSRKDFIEYYNEDYSKMPWKKFEKVEE